MLLKSGKRAPTTAAATDAEAAMEQTKNHRRIDEGNETLL